MFLLVSVRHVGAHPDFEWRDTKNQQLFMSFGIYAIGNFIPW